MWNAVTVRGSLPLGGEGCYYARSSRVIGSVLRPSVNQLPGSSSEMATVVSRWWSSEVVWSLSVGGKKD